MLSCDVRSFTSSEYKGNLQEDADDTGAAPPKLWKPYSNVSPNQVPICEDCVMDSEFPPNHGFCPQPVLRKSKLEARCMQQHVNSER
mmetsp:Transcript_89732/g.168995  ORF Transcript_89732/g.168995 Transcript_89732/m.168995 type:complete len:87 (-) Transcript_89732:245-505(-)